MRVELTPLRLQGGRSRPLSYVGSALSIRLAGSGTATRERLSELARNLADLAAGVTDRRELIQRDVEVHREIYRASGNPYLEDILVRQDNLATRIWCLFIDRLPDLAGHVGEHRRLLEAIAEGAAEDAARLALDHVTRFDAAIRAVV